MVLGCRSDLGYAHQGLGLHAQILYGSFFQPVPGASPTAVNQTNWIAETSDGVKSTIILDAKKSFSDGIPSMRIAYLARLAQLSSTEGSETKGWCWRRAKNTRDTSLQRQTPTRSCQCRWKPWTAQSWRTPHWQCRAVKAVHRHRFAHGASAARRWMPRMEWRKTTTRATSTTVREVRICGGCAGPFIFPQKSLVVFSILFSCRQSQRTQRRQPAHLCPLRWPVRPLPR